MGPACLLRLLCLISGVLHQVRCWTIHVPMTVTAVEGSCAVVPCHTQSHARVIWYKYHNINYPVVYDQQFNQVEAPFRGRTSVMGKAAEGNCTLKIQDVTMADNNLRVYVWINPDSKATQKFHDQTVIIFVERRNPMISVQSVIPEGSIFEVDCSIEHSCPYSPPSIQWHRSHFLQNFTSVTFSSKRGNLWLYRETLRGTATLNMHKTQIGCSAQFRTLTTTSPQTTLNVFGQPANVKIELKKAMIIEGGSITANCAANSYPLPHTYSWIIRQMGINSEINSTQRIMSFHNITRNTSLSCMAYNDIGVGQSDWMDLLVQYAPAILPESSCSLMEDLMRCFCHVEAFPFASISWDIAGNYSHLSSVTTNYTTKPNVVSGEINLPILNQGSVRCIAWNEFGNDTKQLILNITSETSSSLTWLWLVIMGCILMLGFTFCIKQKLNMSRAQPSPAIVQLEDRYYTPLRLEDSDTNQPTPESNFEENTSSCVYDNDFLEDVRTSMGLQQQQKKTFCDEKHEIEPDSKLIYGQIVYGNIDDDCVEKTRYDTGFIAVPLL